MIKRRINTWLSDCFWLIVGIGAMYVFFLGTRPLNTPDEARYSEIPREMVANGHYLIPHLNYIKYFEKPDLFYWLQSLSVKFLGLSEWAMRFWPAAFGLLSCIIVYLGARKLYDRRTALYSAIILATSLLHYALSHLISIDMAVSFFISASLISFIVATNFPMGNQRRSLIYLAAVSAALAVLTKGLIGLVFPGLIVFCWLLFINKWKLLTKLYLVSSIILFATITVPWHIMMAFTQPGWAHFYFITQQFARYATPIAARPGPIWFFLMVLLIGFYPWTVFLPRAIRHAWPKWRERLQYQNEMFLLLWAVIILVFFSLSQSKLIPYILPTMPPLAILMGRFLSIKSKDNAFHFIHYLAIQIVSILFALTLLITPHFDKLPEKNITYFIAALCSVVLFVGPFFVWHFSRVKKYNAFKSCQPTTAQKHKKIITDKNCRSTIAPFFIGLTAMMVVLLPLLNLASTYYYNGSTKPLAEKVRPLLNAHATPIDYHHYYQDLPFYLRHRVVLIHLADELQFGAKLQSMKNWVWTKNTLIQRWQQPQQGRLFLFMSQKDYQSFQQSYPQLTTYLIAETLKNVVISNQESPQ